MADQLMTYKYIIKNVAYKNGYTATFMPKPFGSLAGSKSLAAFNGEFPRSGR